MKDWCDLDSDSQLALRMAYDAETSSGPGTCALDQKIARFSTWLETKGVRFDETMMRKGR